MQRQLRCFTFGIVVLFLVGLHIPLIAGENSSLKWKSFDEGMAEAKKSNKKLLVDVYTDWCGWCKKMDASTYGNAEVAAYLNQQYYKFK